MEKIEAITEGASIKIRWKGIFDFAGLYNFIHDWLVNKRMMEFHEKRYKDKPESALGPEIEVEIYGERRVTEYVKYVINVDYHLWESKEISVVVNGKQVKRLQGRIDIQISGEVITDWQNKFKDYPKLEKFLNKVILKRELEIKHIDPMEHDMHDFASRIKKFLNIESE